MKRVSALAALAVFAFIGAARAELIEHLPGAEKRVALTFDGCEAPGRPAWFDQTILSYLKSEKLPFTLFVTGLFAQRNREQLAELVKSPLVEVENHSFDHPRRLEVLSESAQREQIERTDAVIAEITGRRPLYFRFPGGNYDQKALALAEAEGHKVVHWSFASGDPSPGLKPTVLRDWVTSKTKPGSILIFHVNGRAPATGRALPDIVAELRRKGYEFVRLDEVLK